MGQIPEPCAFYMTRTQKNLCCERAQRKRRIYRLGSKSPFAVTGANDCFGPPRTVYKGGKRTFVAAAKQVTVYFKTGFLPGGISAFKVRLLV